VKIPQALDGVNSENDVVKKSEAWDRDDSGEGFVKIADVEARNKDFKIQ